MDDEKLLARVRSILELMLSTEQKTKNLEAGLSMSAARCHMATALTTLEKAYGDRVRAAYDKAYLEHQARVEQ